MLKTAATGAENKNMSRRIIKAAVALAVSLTTSAVSLVAVNTAVHAGPTAATYTVQSGDYLTGIAAKLHVTLADLLAVNNLTVKSTIVPGQKLVVPGPSTHQVKAGDYLSGIAATYGVSLSSLLAANGITATTAIHPGQALRLPAGASAATGKVSSSTSGATTATYTVRPGDYLTGIASRFSVRTGDLLTINKLTLTSVIFPGQQLKLPSGAKAGAAASTTSSKLNTVIAYATAQVGKPYKFFTAGPNTFDCSGLMLAAYRQIGVYLPHYSVAQARYGRVVDWTSEQIRPGDMVFLFSSDNPTAITHVGMALSATTWIQAPAPGDVVRIGAIPRWRIQGVRRLVES